MCGRPHHRRKSRVRIREFTGAYLGVWRCGADGSGGCLCGLANLGYLPAWARSFIARMVKIIACIFRIMEVARDRLRCAGDGPRLARQVARARPFGFCPECRQWLPDQGWLRVHVDQAGALGLCPWCRGDGHH